MSWSLQIKNGDLSLLGSNLATVTNEDKMVQDLRCALMEHMGNDSMHPEFGSLIDGGQKPDGTQVSGLIGQSDIDIVVMVVESEILRVIKDYQGKQLSRAKADRLTYNKSTLTAGEVIVSVQGIKSSVSLDQLFINVSVQSGKGNALNFTVPVDATGLTL